MNIWFKIQMAQKVSNKKQLKGQKFTLKRKKRGRAREKPLAVSDMFCFFSKKRDWKQICQKW